MLQTPTFQKWLHVLVSISHCHYSTLGSYHLSPGVWQFPNGFSGLWFHSRSFSSPPPEWAFENVILSMLFLQWLCSPSRQTPIPFACNEELLSLYTLPFTLFHSGLTSHRPPTSSFSPDTMSQPFQALRVALTSHLFCMTSFSYWVTPYTWECPSVF